MISMYELSQMNSSEYKKFHESFMENNYGSTATHTFFCIFFTVQCSIFASIGHHNPAPRRYLYEYFLIILPLIAAHTVLSDYIYLLNFVIFTILLYEFIYHYDKLHILKTFKQQNIFHTAKIKSISQLRALTYVITVFSILAVDFQDFPRYLAKTEKYGYSFMDTGVGLFVLMSGLVHKDINRENYIHVIKGNTKFICILIFLGFARFLSVKQLDYQEHVTEYGVHWNFFFTLAVCKLMSTLLLCVSSNALLFSIATHFMHEYTLFYRLESWVFSNNSRTSFLDANREGIASCLGYVSLYLFAVYIKNVLNDRTVRRCYILLKFTLGSIFLWCMLSIVNTYRPTSRTLANAGYCLYLEATLVTILTILYFLEVLFDNKTNDLYFRIPSILEAVNINGLTYFLFANLCTGFINLNIHTLFVPTRIAFLILNMYMILTTAVTILLKKRGFKL